MQQKRLSNKQCCGSGWALPGSGSNLIRPHIKNRIPIRSKHPDPDLQPWVKERSFHSKTTLKRLFLSTIFGNKGSKYDHYYYKMMFHDGARKA